MSTNLFDANALNEPGNTIDKSIQEVERTMARTGDTSCLFDPVWSPAMWELANKTMQDMRWLYADLIADAADSDVFLYYPGVRQFYAYRHDVARFAYMLTFCWPRGCDIKLARGGCRGSEVYVPLQRGQFIVVFGICHGCDNWARQTAETNFRVKVMEAQAKLPPGARIDPGSPVPPIPKTAP